MERFSHYVILVSFLLLAACSGDKPSQFKPGAGAGATAPIGAGVGG
ncbi:MAG TPA: hypothetical protein VL574_07755 [Stellaceae bacterium]|nr:hypothetical protein [Stellaceae bacterium]